MWTVPWRKDISPVSSCVEKLVMNPIMWMSQYNPERLEDATSFYGQSTVLSVMDDLPHQATMVSIFQRVLVTE